MKKNIAIKFLVWFIIMTFSMTIANSNLEEKMENKTYETLEEFEKAEGKTCKIATDWCNTIMMNNGKAWATTLKMCFAPQKYSCIERINDKKTNEEKKAEFTKENSETCQIASDGVNNHTNINWEFIVTTRVWYWPDFEANWTCIKEKSNEKLTENDKNLKNHLKNQIWSANVDKIENFLKIFDKKLVKLETEEKQKEISKLKWKVRDFLFDIHMKNPADKALSPKDSFNYNFIKYLDLRLTEIY